MEINGRFWGSLPLAYFSGVDFPHLYYQLAAKEELGEATEYEKGVLSRHFLGDLSHLLSVLFSRSKIRSFAFPSRLKAIGDFIYYKGRYDVFSPYDLKPFFAEIMDVLSKKFKKHA